MRVPDSTGLKPGDKHYRAYVGDPRNYDFISSTSFQLLTTLGMRQQHQLLDIGCGSLRNARLLIPYLDQSHYTGIEPNRWLVKDGLRYEVGKQQIKIKKASFSYRADTAGLPKGMKYDFILAQSIFSHCGADLLQTWIEQLSARIADGGMLVATYMRKDVDSGESGWLYPGLVTYLEETFTGLLAPYGLDYHRITWPHPVQTWFVLTRSTPCCLGEVNTIGEALLRIRQTRLEQSG